MKLFWGFWALVILLAIALLNLAAPGQVAEFARIAAEFDTGQIYLLAAFYLTYFFIALFCLFTLLYILRPRRKKGILLYKNKKISITLDERNIKRIIQSFYRQFPEIKLSKITVKNKKSQVDLDIDLLILPTYNVPQLADRLKEKTLTFLKDLYAKEILNELNFNIMVDEKQLEGMIDRGEDLRPGIEKNTEEIDDDLINEETFSLEPDEEKIEND